jgi:hypothetical protein
MSIRWPSRKMRAMVASRLPRWLLFVFALLLLGGQQAAFAHMLGHALGEVAHASHNRMQSGDEEHGAALSLSHVCTTCIALDAFAAIPPGPARLAFAGSTAAVAPAPTYSTCLAARSRPYAARAPPLTL